MTASATDPRLQGVWKLMSCTSGGTDVFTTQTHLVFAGAVCWRVDPDTIQYDDQPPAEQRFETDVAASPARLVVHQLYARGEGGGFDERARRAIYAVDGDRLTIAWTAHRDFPEVMTDEHRGPIDRFQRESDPEMAARLREPPARVSRARRVHRELGTLEWDAKLRWWSGHVAWAGAARVRLHVSLPHGASEDILDRAAAIVRRLNARTVYAHAAVKLMKLHNETWREWTDEKGEEHAGPVLNAEQFMAKLSPEGIKIDDEGGVDVYLNDGGLFWGHAVIVSLDPEMNPTRADIAG
jgi:uncharacterized protein (TIGR03067 family)